MPLPAVILFVAALLATALAAIGWAQDPDAPPLGGLILAKATEGGLWSGLLLFLAAAAVFAWRGRRPGPGGPGIGRPRRRDPEA